MGLHITQSHTPENDSINKIYFERKKNKEKKKKKKMAHFLVVNLKKYVLVACAKNMKLISIPSIIM